MNESKRRKNYFIKKKFQANFFLKFTLLLLLEAVLIAALFMYISQGTLTTAYGVAGLTIQRTSAYFFISFILISLIVGIAIGIAGIFVFMYLSHRIGGPLYRFEKTVEDAQKGNLSQRVNLRKTDQLLELRKGMNSFLDNMDSRISHIKNELKKALAISGEKSQDALDRIKKILEEIKSSLDYFKTSK